jgi:hypothetical protein
MRYVVFQKQNPPNFLGQSHGGIFVSSGAGESQEILVQK